jgi:hypothetical protein
VDVSKAGRRIRVAATLLVAVGLFYGTLWGSDADFPIGPFRMYSTSRDLNEPVGDTEVYAVNGRGERFNFTSAYPGMRRAEIEGQLSRFEADPSLLAGLAEAYADRYPDRPVINEISVVVNWIEIADGRPTGHSWTEEKVEWRR